MSRRRILRQAEPLLGSELAEQLDLIFEFFASAGGVAALEPVLIEDCEASIPALVLP